MIFKNEERLVIKEKGRVKMIRDDDDDEDEIIEAPLAISCKYCGKGSLVWMPRFPDGKGPWRLVEPDGSLHSCKEYRKEAK
jgi:hypothetical protein